METASCDVCRATTDLDCTKTHDGANENGTAFVFPDYATVTWSMTGNGSEKQRTWTDYACALSYHLIFFFHFPLSVTLTVNESWNVLFYNLQHTPEVRKPALVVFFVSFSQKQNGIVFDPM